MSTTRDDSRKSVNLPVTVEVVGDQRVIHVGAWTLTTTAATDEEPRIRDLDLAERLGYERPRKIRDLIDRLLREEKLNDIHQRPAVGRRAGQVAAQPVTEFWLTEAQALKVVAKSETAKADAILDEVIAVFIAARRGLLPQAPPAGLTAEQLTEVLAPLLARIASLEAQGGRPCLGNGGARIHVLDPLREVARIEARAVGRTDDKTLRAMRMAAEETLRDRLSYPRKGGQSWAFFPQARLGELHCALARLLHDARKRAQIAAPQARQGSFSLVEASTSLGKLAALAKPN